MKNLLLATVASIALIGGLVPASAGNHLNDHVCNGQCGGNDGKKNGWVDNGNGFAPKGLGISGANGRVDNGSGNGGENLEGKTPNKNGEDGGGDDDPN